MSRWGTLNVPEGWKSLREELSPEKKEPSVTRLLLEDLRCQWASQGYSAHMMPLKPLSRFGPCESVPRGVWCVCAVCVCVCVCVCVGGCPECCPTEATVELGRPGPDREKAAGTGSFIE